MPVLIEGVSVLLKKGAVIERYTGGYGQFLFDLNGHKSLTSSNQLLCVQYENHEQARAYLQLIAQKGLKVGLINIENPSDTDAVLVDQVFGPSIRVWWLDFITLDQSSDLAKTKLRKKILNQLCKLIAILKIKNGLIHCQFITSRGKNYILEVTRRLPGDFYGDLINNSF